MIALVAGSDQFFELAVFLGVGLGVTHHFFDFLVTQAGVGLDHDGLLFAGCLVLGGHIEDTVGIDVKGHLDLWHATRSRRDVCQVETAKGLVLGCLLALTLQHVNGHGVLVVFGSGEHLGLFARDGGVLLDQGCHHTTHSFNTQGQRGHVQQQDVLDVTGQYRTLNGRTHGNSFIRVDVLARFGAKEVGNSLLHQRHAGLATDQNHVVDGFCIQTGILQGNLARFQGTLDQIFHQRLQLGTGHLDVQVLGTRGVSSYIWQVDVGLLGRRQLDLGFFSSFFQALHGQRIAFEIHAVFFLELVRQVVDQADVEVFTTQEGVTIGGQYFKLVLAVDLGNFNYGNVKSTTTQVVNDDGAIALGLVHAVSQCGGSRLVDDALDVKTGNAAGILGRLALTVVKVGRNSNYCLGYALAQVVLGGFFHLLQYFGADLRRSHFIALDLNPGITVVGLDDAVRHHLDVFLYHVFVKTAANQAFDSVQGVLRVGYRLALGCLADQNFAIVGVGDDGRGGATAFGVFNNLGNTVFQYGNAGVGCSKVNTNNLAHYGLHEIWPSKLRLGSRALFDLMIV